MKVGIDMSHYLKTYRSHKTVQAAKITGIVQFLSPSVPQGSGATLMLEHGYSVYADQAYMDKHKPEVGGYYVRYADGYESFSPAKAFEDGYTVVPD